MKNTFFPKKQGLYDPQFEKDSCGVGFVCDIKGRQSNEMLHLGIQSLNRLLHRGATGADPETGDGAGILIQIPDEFFQKETQKIGIDLPPLGEYGTGLIFLPPDKKERQFCKDIFTKIIKQEQQKLLGWRRVPVDDSSIGKTARQTQPVIEQIFIAKDPKVKKQIYFERRLYVIRKQIENIIRASNLKQKSYFYVNNISSRTFAYKGLLISNQLENFFLDLKDKSLKTALCLVHARYSTNTFPTWDLAQPFRFLAHNGEINTLQGNINWMRAREGLLQSEVFSDQDIEKIKSIIVPGGSDSATIDNVFELLALTDKSLPHAMMMLIPGAWQENKLMDKKLKDFYKYHACFMEPWDGPAAIAFTDGVKIGAVLDRNGLRPARYIVTKKNFVVMASEVGVLDIAPEDILLSGRLEPGKIFYIDTEKGEIVEDNEIKLEMAERHPYGHWMKEQMVDLDKMPAVKNTQKIMQDRVTFLKAFGYTREDLKFIIKFMAENGEEPTGSMGDDTPPAILSKEPELLYNYFKQLFAQVTNPAIDPIRENLVMSLESYIGSEKNILAETSLHCHKLRVKKPVLSNEDLEKIRNIKKNDLKTKTISVLFSTKNKDNKEFIKALDKICAEAVMAIKEGYTFIILSDRGVNKEYAAIPILLALGAVHHFLVKKALRSQIGIIIESAEPREVHHFALLFGYGADCINSYLAYDAIKYLIDENRIELDYDIALSNYRKAVDKGIFKILSKMGISTLQSYKGAQIFEALGLKEEIINRCFLGTVSRIGGAGFDVIIKETLLRHEKAYSQKETTTSSYLDAGGVYQWKRNEKFHLWNPQTISALQNAVRQNSYSGYKEFARTINDQSENPATLRSLFKFKKTGAIPINKVEPAEKILKRFVTGAMSFGSISKGAHESIAIAMNRLGARSNTGEGGEDPARFKPSTNGNFKRSAIKQVASGRFGVTTNYLVNADELQIKIAQGAKPGEGGQLPGHKVSPAIAQIRYTTPGVILISPPPHHDIYSIEDLAQLIFDLKNTNPGARISVKLVSEMGVGTVAAGVAKGHADMILISGGDGGTGASPRSSIRYAGLPWELGISETHQTLVLNDLRSRVRLQTDGQMRTGRDIAIAALLGADEFGFGSVVLVVLGCMMLRHCHLNNCSLGVATQDEVLQERFKGKPEHIENYFRFVAEEIREIMAELGFSKMDEMVGRTDLLEINQNIIPWKAKNIDYSGILYQPQGAHKFSGSIEQDHGIEYVLDKKLIEYARPALEQAQKVSMELKIKNVNRTTGAMLSGKVCKKYGEKALAEDTICFKFKGVAGQSFGAWLAKGITFELEGLANDYIGKGISGGKIIVYPDKKSDYKPEENIIIGNTTFYGAIAGEAYICGVAGERFCIRNSGLYAVVEGVGDHGCEYMTGGRVVILGKTGRNFAAGMSGGIAYVYDEKNNFKDKCNLNMVELEKIDKEDEKTVYDLLNSHYIYTQSSRAKTILDNFKNKIKKFIKVMPVEYKRVLEEKRKKETLDLEGVSNGRS